MTSSTPLDQPDLPTAGDRHVGRAAVVGAAGGIGLAIAQELVRTPWVSEVIVGDLDEAKAHSVAQQLQGHPIPCRASPVDVTDERAIESFVQTCGDVEFLVVAVGVFDSGDSLSYEPARFERVLAVNLVGAFYCAQRFARDMVTRKSGSIVGVASIAARMPRLKQVGYSASKAGMRQAYRVLGLEIASSGVRVNTVSPGPTDTDMMRRLMKDHPSVDDLAAGSGDAFRPPIPRGLVARPHDVAAATVFLLSPVAAHITMTDLVVDGGETLGL